MEVERQTVQQDAQGGVQSVHIKEEVPSVAAVKASEANQMNSYVWYIVGFLEILLLFRLAFLLLGAHNTGFAAILYQVTHPLVGLFAGIFPAPGTDTGYFDTAALLAMVVYALIGWGIVSLIDINKRGKTA